MRTSIHQAPQAMVVTRMVWVWSRMENQPSDGISTMPAEAQNAARGASTSRAASHMRA